MPITHHRDLVTICIPAYRGGELLATAIESAQGQSHSRLRILVSVDACVGPDDSATIARRY